MTKQLRPSFHTQLMKALSQVDEVETPYQISKLLSAESNPANNERKAIEKRWQRWLSGLGLKTIEMLQSDLEKMGLELTIQKKIIR